MFRQLACLLVVIALAGCSGSTQAVPCQTLVKDYDAAMKDILARLDTAQQDALLTSRTGAAPPVEPLQAIRDETASILPPACAAKSHDLLLESMDEHLAGYAAFTNTEGFAVVRPHFIRSSDLMLQYQQDIAALLRGEPLPDITATP
jgi:hypothetical protein